MTRPEPLSSAAVDTLIGLWPHGDHPDGTEVHAVVDAARDLRLIGLMDSTGLERCCLFTGTLTPALRAAAPHLCTWRLARASPAPSCNWAGATAGAC